MLLKKCSYAPPEAVHRILYFNHSHRKLHCHTMKRAVLLDEGTTVDTYNFSARERAGNQIKGKSVVVGLGVGGHKHSIVGDKKVVVGLLQTYSSLMAS